MSTAKPFIPRDRPKSWVMGHCAVFFGIAIVLVGFLFAWLGIKIIHAIAIGLFLICWARFAIFWLVYVFRLISGRYSNLQPKPWSEKIW